MLEQQPDSALDLFSSFGAHRGRAGTPDDVTAIVLFLASPAASHITGQTVHVNGGALSR
jgi:NAD(P)-dependent dehydrogenase (short-subunit alcohol dehydrogenase family)